MLEEDGEKKLWEGFQSVISGSDLREDLKVKTKCEGRGEKLYFLQPKKGKHRGKKEKTSEKKRGLDALADTGVSVQSRKSPF